MAFGKVVVVGGGVIGLCSAYYALKRGFPVTVLEREPAGGDNCTVHNAGLVVPSHFIPLAAPGMIARGLRMLMNPESPFFVRPKLSTELMRWAWLFYRHSTEKHVAQSKELLRDLNLESRRLFCELQADEDFGLETRGLLMLCKTAARLEEEAEIGKQAREIGLKVNVLDAAETSKLDPDVTMDIAGAVHFLEDCHLDPARFMDSMRRRVLALGGVIENGVEIDQFEISGGKIVSVSAKGRKFEGGNFIVSGGSWSAKILKSIEMKLPLQPGKGYSLTLPKPPELPKLCSIFTEASVAVTPIGNGLRFAGTMEIGSMNRSIDRARVRGIVKSVQPYFPKFSEKDFEGIEPWAGLRPVSADGLPYVGKVPNFANLFAATGHAMMGLSLAPITGRLISDLLAGDAPFRPVEALSPGRF